jgi:hypothetical protein
MKKEIIYTIIGAILLLLLFKVFKNPIKKTMAKISRGLRNKNPGNIIKTKSLWEGEINGSDERFKTFKTMAYGYRAMYLLLESYLKKGRNTIEKIISVYAPSSENDTKSYINNVSKLTGFQTDEALTSNDLTKLIFAISKIENGINPIAQEINEGKNLFYNV